MSETNENPLVSVGHTLSRFDVVDLLTAVGALQLMPKNADRSKHLKVGQNENLQ